MNDHETDQDNKKKQEPQISIDLDGSVIQLPISTFINIIECEITNNISKIETKKKDVIDLNDLVNVQCWKTNYNELKTQAKVLHSIIERLERDLKDNMFAQPMRCTASSVNQNVYITNITMNIKTKMAMNAHKNSNKEYQIFTISESEDDVIVTDTSKIKPIQDKNIIDMIDLVNDTQDFKVKNKSDPKSIIICSSDSEDDSVIITDETKIEPIQTLKTNISIPNLKTNDNDKVLPIKTKATKTLSYGEYLSSTILKRKPGSKSKTMFVGDMVPNSAENEETVEKKMRLNECEVINNKESSTKNVLNRNSVKKLEVPEMYNNNFSFKSSNFKYPPPYPLVPPHNNQPSWKNVPPRPNMTITTSGNKVTLTWDLNLTWQTAEIKMYELFVCQETDAPPDISMWKKKGNIESDLLPMGCELEVFDLGHIYHFALRAVDVHNRRAPFAVQKIKI